MRHLDRASVVARSEVAGWFVDRDDFRALVAGRDSEGFALQRAVTAVLAAKLRAATARLLEHPAAEDRPAAQPIQRARCEPSYEWRRFLPVLPFFEGFPADDIAALVEAARSSSSRAAPPCQPQAMQDTRPTSCCGVQ